MAYDERTRVSALAGAQTVDPGLRAYMLRVYNFMAAALALSGLSAYVSLDSGLFAAPQAINWRQPAFIGIKYQMFSKDISLLIMIRNCLVILAVRKMD